MQTVFKIYACEGVFGKVMEMHILKKLCMGFTIVLYGDTQYSQLFVKVPERSYLGKKFSSAHSLAVSQPKIGWLHLSCI